MSTSSDELEGAIESGHPDEEQNPTNEAALSSDTDQAEGAAGESETSSGESETAEDNEAPDPVAEQVSRLATKRRSRVADVGVALPETHGRVVLSEMDDPYRSFAIPVSLDQASMIATYLKERPRRRPLLSDVFVDVVKQFGLSVVMVTITARQGDLYFAEITLGDMVGNQKVVPARPSDAILVALASSVPPPIMVEEALYGGPAPQ